jgi:hypothetical protein
MWGLKEKVEGPLDDHTSSFGDLYSNVFTRSYVEPAVDEND